MGYHLKEIQMPATLLEKIETIAIVAMALTCLAGSAFVFLR